MTRIACIGGFLGSGKTTAILQAARAFVDRGMKVGIITNDQGHQLVDTALVRSLGLHAEEIGGGCFCCRFPEFAKNAERLAKQAQADIILAEAVGSCTDLSATVCQRLRRYYSGQFTVSPLTVMVDPGRVQEMLGSFSPFNEDVRYLFGKQLAEADHIILTKADLFNEGQLECLQKQIRDLVGTTHVSTMSARTGSGVEEWLNLILREPATERKFELDYDRYGAAEASLGWLNATLDLAANHTFCPTDLAEAFVSVVQQVCRGQKLGIAHLKAMIVSPEGSNWIALTGTQGTAAWGQSYEIPDCRDASMIINARVCATPEQLEHMVRESVFQVSSVRQVVSVIRHLEAFSPPPPTRPEISAHA